jgi:heme-degrading monooxygenase HmoA
VTRYVVPPDGADDFLARAAAALDVLATRRGWRAGRVGRAADDGSRWVVTTEWDSVGAYRRAISASDVKVAVAPLFGTAIDEPSAYEVVLATGLGSAGLAAPTARADDA